MNVVDAMLELAKVGPSDFVIDLGSGDGRVVIAAARKYGARGLGVELDGALVSDARREAQRQGVGGRVEFLAQNLFITDLAQATVVTTYLYPRINIQLRPRLFEQLRPGSRVVSHEFDFGAWKPDAHVTVKVPDKPYGPPRSDVYLWIVPANAAGVWRWQVAVDGSPLECELALDQTFQTLRGTARVGGQPARLEEARLRGDEIGLTVVVDRAGARLRQTLVGRISGDAIEGRARLSPGAEAPWQATRSTRGRIDIDAAAALRASGRPA